MISEHTPVNNVTRGYVYLMLIENQFYKIGSSRDMISRRAWYNPLADVKLIMCMPVFNPRPLEQLLLNRFNNYYRGYSELRLYELPVMRGGGSELRNLDAKEVAQITDALSSLGNEAIFDFYERANCGKLTGEEKRYLSSFGGFDYKKPDYFFFEEAVEFNRRMT